MLRSSLYGVIWLYFAHCSCVDGIRMRNPASLSSDSLFCACVPAQPEKPITTAMIKKRPRLMPNDSLLLFMLDDLLKFYYESSSINLFSCMDSGLSGRF